ncbi:MORN repeat protein [Leptospira ryugenii]|uniref:MORN repeat protein n=1 Tax=Leptospira ryugenii TaxID=1917863 RepID=A0A2P2DXY4_9LEPT|nr:MORN repeat protein [Leptospira ryugenii]
MHGLGKRYFANSGILESEGFYKDGKLNGKGKTYYESGNLKSEGTYAHEELSGKGKVYHENG